MFSFYRLLEELDKRTEKKRKTDFEKAKKEARVDTYGADKQGAYLNPTIRKGVFVNRYGEGHRFFNRDELKAIVREQYTSEELDVIKSMTNEEFHKWINSGR